jgi:hypothetical protein
MIDRLTSLAATRVQDYCISWLGHELSARANIQPLN